MQLTLNKISKQKVDENYIIYMGPTLTNLIKDAIDF